MKYAHIHRVTITHSNTLEQYRAFVSDEPQWEMLVTDKLASFLIGGNRTKWIKVRYVPESVRDLYEQVKKLN